MILIIFLLIFTVIVLFSFPQFSPIPYFPSNKRDLPLITKALNLQNNQTVIDLGAGDGIVIFEAAYKTERKKLNTQFIAIELNPFLVLILHLRRLFHPNRNNIHIIRDDIFTVDYPSFMLNPSHLTFYMYISPWHMKKTLNNIERQFRKFEVISYFYPLPSTFNFRTKKVAGINSIYIYKPS